MPKKNISHICDYCGKEHFIDKGTYNKLLSGKYKHSYCSIKCKSMAQENKLKVVCTNCGKLFLRKESHIKRHINQFCCVECESKYYHFQHTEERICEICKEKFIVPKSSPQRFCSIQCQNKWQTTISGENHPCYKREMVRCECCNNEIHVKQYKIRNGQHNFCSTKCRQKWFADVWSQSDECKEKSREVMLNLLTSGKISTTNSYPQKVIDNLLDSMKIEYDREYIVQYYSIDNYLSYSNLMIEVQGDYWHGNPNKFKTSLTRQQIERISRDKAKHTYIKNHFGIEILYLWENDICNNLILCEKLINLYIKMNGKLDNYHSFNYYINDNFELCLKQNLVIPYQDMKIEQYKHIYKDVS